MQIHIAILTAVALAVIVTAARAQERVSISGLYTDMHHGAKTGDVGGVSVQITYTGAGYYVIFQIAEGVPDVPVVVPLTVRGNSVSFTFPPESEYSRGLQTFTGVVSAASLSGRFANGYEVQLARLRCTRP